MTTYRPLLALGTALAITLAGCVTMQEAAPADLLAAAIADPARPAADRERDANRKPAEIVGFAGVTRGQVIAEIAPGGGYYTRILARAVGPEGRVYALMPPFFANRPGGLDAINAIAAEYGNVTVVVTEFNAIALPEKADLVWTTENYHDLANRDAAPVNASVFAALKPGGIYFVEDHEAAAGTGLEATSTLHRIDPAAVIEQVTAAGFRLEAQSDALANPADPKTLGVRDEGIAGRTEKFALRFRKPG